MQLDAKKEITDGEPRSLRISTVNARNTLGRLLDRVARGQWVIIDRDREAVGVLISVADLVALNKAASQRLDNPERVRLDV